MNRLQCFLNVMTTAVIVGIIRPYALASTSPSTDSLLNGERLSLHHTLNLQRAKRMEQLHGEVRPFITDDARVVGDRLAQLESWGRYERENFQQWVMIAYGPTAKLELAVGGVFGVEKDPEQQQRVFSYALPLLQVKYLFREYQPNKPPGFGLVLGTFLPSGLGSFKPPGFGTFGFLTITQCFGEGEKLLIHGNAGLNYLHIDQQHDLISTWGFGTQTKVVGGFHIVSELFSGDPYVPGAGTAFQVGFRHFINDLFQIDMTYGKGIHGENRLPSWFSAGVRLVSTRFQKKQLRNQ